MLNVADRVKVIRGNFEGSLTSYRDDLRLELDYAPRPEIDKEGNIIGIETMLHLFYKDEYEIPVDPHRIFLFPRENFNFWERVWDQVLTTPAHEGWGTKGTVTDFHPYSDGWMETQAATYSDARNGTGGSVLFTSVDPSNNLTLGQQFTGGAHRVFETFISWDTSSLSGESVTAVTLKAYNLSDASTVDFIASARRVNYGSPITSSSWVDGATLAAATEVATFNSASFATGYQNWTSTANFPAAINTTGATQLLLVSTDQVNNSQPTNSSYFQIVPHANNGGAFDQVLTITHSPATLVTPNTLALILMEFAPQLQYTINAASPTALGITTFAPNVLTPVLTVPSVLALLTSTFIPAISVGPSPSPTTTALSTASFAPVIGTAINIPVKALTLATFIPILNLSINTSTTALTTASFAPIVTVSNTPITKALVITTFAPVINLTINVPLRALVLHGLQLNTPGSMVTVTTSSTADSTKTPGAHGVLLALTTGDEVLIYQAGTEGPGGLCYKLSGNRGSTWGAATQISSNVNVVPTSVVQRNTNDIHLCYSLDESSPTLATTSSVFYRRLNYTGTAGTPSFIIGSELVVMQGSTTVAYERASMSIDTDYVPFVAAVRYTATGTTIACAIGAVAGNLAGASIATTSVVGINVLSPDVSLAATTLGTKWFVAVQSGGTCWLTRAIGPNVGQTSITFTSVTSFGTDTVHTISALGDPTAANNTNTNNIGIAYIRNTILYVVLWDDINQLLGTPVQVITAAQRAILSHDGIYFWVYFITRNGSSQVSAYANERAGWSPSGANSTATELWDWPQAPLRLDDAQISNFVWCETNQTPNHILSSRTEISVPKEAGDSGLAVEIISTKRPVADSSIGTDLLALIQHASETPIGTDVGIMTITPKVTDSGTAIDRTNKKSVVNENRVGTDTVNTNRAMSETGTGIDTALFKNQAIGSENSTGTETTKSLRALNETGTAIDSIKSIGRILSDILSGVDFASIKLVQAQAGTLTDIAKRTSEARETATGLDAISGRKIEVPEAGQGADLIFRLNRPITESGSGLDVSKSSRVAIDAFTAVDTATQSTRSLSVTLRLLVTKSSLKLRTEGW